MPILRRALSIFPLLFLIACQAPTSTPVPIDDIPNFFPTRVSPTSTYIPIPTFTEISATSTPKPSVPNFDHIVIIMLENNDYDAVIGNPQMQIYNKLANEYTLLTQYYAITHPSLPNYLALIGGDTFGIKEDCIHCFVKAQSLPDLIETSHRTWKTYQEDMPSPCFIGDKDKYYQKHNPFIYFDAIRLNQSRCTQHVVPLTVLQTDIDAGTLPNFIFISPNICDDSHDCSLDTTDEWLTDQLNILFPALNKANQPYLIVVTFDEGEKSDSCCGLPKHAGGRIAAVLISSQVKNGFQDDTPYTQYSLLKTISAAWGLPYLGHAADDNVTLITAPWVK